MFLSDGGFVSLQLIGVVVVCVQDLENYVFEQIPQMVQLADLEKDFYPYYVFTAVRKFVFFLDPMKKGMLSLLMLACHG